MNKKPHLENRKDDFQIPKSALDSLARRLYPAIREYFESEEGQKEFEEWKKQREHKKE
ncbi:MAG: hypothetical protein VB081_00890 [Christensenella sp.]|uniref:hypothetical protein n=1 Tax=Christensenella sp. TaxID=1935934 RepID=UPI002B1F7508|nr:hypothetical protein [Christensenella sp.]MEA5002046.1 hypothetical protein [Christensenella sp.]